MRAQILGLTPLIGIIRVGTLSAATLDDARNLLGNYDDLLSADAQIAADRAAMQTALTSNGNLRDIVRQFFTDRDHAASIDQNLLTNRVRLRRDVGFVPTKILKPAKAQGLQIDAANYIKDFDGRSTKFNAVQTDLSNMRSSVANNDVNGTTSNANLYLNDRHALVQFHTDEGGDIAAMRKDLRFRRAGNVSRPRHTSLSDQVSRYLTDRQAWLNAGTAVAADREAIRAGLNSASLTSLVTQFLTDHHRLALLEKQLAVDRDIMRLSVGFKLGRRASNFFGSIVGVKNNKEDLVGNEDIDQDVSIENVGEK
jgi:hypothetical protein